MSINEVQARIGAIQSLMLAARTAPTGKATSTGATASGATSASQFAAVLQGAVDQAGGTAATTRTAATAAPSRTAGTTTTGWTLPVRGASVSSEFGHRWGTEHEGTDFAAGMGTPIRAATGGVVKKASWYGGYGNAVIVDHGNGVQTLYGHASKLLVKEGQRVAAGQQIAKVGSTGDSTGPHLHFEVHVKDKPVDPRPWLAKHGVKL
ncbi:hypothetical protein GCM10010124_32420 [Pilimelia terevasa]|uniref:M23ase beta-sheet core domain-containing protein n=1 Tax=Pilimelia terevasa TaxID=53372 RepID=A0A8J3FLR7_9ACTN|nr:M23 family metallopeptidase [Pilimelia terevasa]GGK37228.1 hypothetical protein GCM10010124_32420 [Pilimelia terevasa]